MNCWPISSNCRSTWYLGSTRKLSRDHEIKKTFICGWLYSLYFSQPLLHEHICIYFSDCFVTQVISRGLIAWTIPPFRFTARACITHRVTFDTNQHFAGRVETRRINVEFHADDVTDRTWHAPSCAQPDTTQLHITWCSRSIHVSATWNMRCST